MTLVAFSLHFCIQLIYYRHWKVFQKVIFELCYKNYTKVFILHCPKYVIYLQTHSVWYFNKSISIVPESSFSDFLAIWKIFYFKILGPISFILFARYIRKYQSYCICISMPLVLSKHIFFVPKVIASKQFPRQNLMFSRKQFQAFVRKLYEK